MSIQSEINRITGFRNSSLSAVSDKGVVVPNGSAIDDLPELIQRIPAYSAVSGYDPANGTITISSIAVKVSDLTWTYNSNYSRFQSTSLQSLINKPSAQAVALAGLFCQNYKTVGASYVTATDKSIGVTTGGTLMIHDSSYNQVSAFTTAMGDVTIVLPLETPSSGGGGVDMVTVDITGEAIGTWYIPSNGENDGFFITVPANSIIVKVGHPINGQPTGSIVVKNAQRITATNYYTILDVGASGGSIGSSQSSGGGGS